MRYKTLKQARLKNKTVILRSDLNSDVQKGKLMPSERIKAAVETIKDLKKKKAKVVILAHQSRPGKKDFVSIRQHAKRLSQYTKVNFINDITGEKAKRSIKNLDQGQAIILENIRKEEDEFKTEKKSNSIIKNLVPLADAYVNDAFSVSHRKQASITEFPKKLPSYIGKLMEKELKSIEKLNLKNTLYILAGAKPKDNIKLLEKNKSLTGGLFAPLCLMAKGQKLGKEEEILKENKKLVPKIKSKLGKTMNPKDFAIESKGKRDNINIENLPSKKKLLDIGNQTIKDYSKEIRSHKGAIYMKGPMGYYQDSKFNKGTKEILKAISKSKSYSLIGGGDLNEALKKKKVNKKKFNHVSLSGGALLSYIAGEKLPGLEALKN